MSDRIEQFVDSLTIDELRQRTEVLRAWIAYRCRRSRRI
jgi:hypothetical protein